MVTCFQCNHLYPSHNRFEDADYPFMLLKSIKNPMGLLIPSGHSCFQMPQGDTTVETDHSGWPQFNCFCCFHSVSLLIPVLCNMILYCTLQQQCICYSYPCPAKTCTIFAFQDYNSNLCPRIEVESILYPLYKAGVTIPQVLRVQTAKSSQLQHSLNNNLERTGVFLGKVIPALPNPRTNHRKSLTYIRIKKANPFATR